MKEQCYDNVMEKQVRYSSGSTVSGYHKSEQCCVIQMKEQCCSIACYGGAVMEINFANRNVIVLGTSSIVKFIWRTIVVKFFKDFFFQRGPVL